MSRLTPKEVNSFFQRVEFATENWHYRPHTAVDSFRKEIKALGGPLCIDCEENQARYTTDRCALCDMKLPPDERGRRLIDS